MAKCRTWADHEWGGRRLKEAGRHPTLGLFQRYAVACERCGHTVTETDWTPAPAGADRQVATTQQSTGAGGEA